MKLLVLLSLSCFLPGPWLAADETRGLILVAGQSNAVGFDAYASQLPSDPADAKVLFWWRCGDPPPDEHDSTGAEWTSLRPQPQGKPLSKKSAAAATPPHPDAARQYGNFSRAEGGFGPEIGFARTLVGRESSPLSILKVAFSGTSVAKDWNPAGACYRALVAELKSARDAAEIQGLTLRPRALVWVQGEGDANAEAAPRYQAALGAMLTKLRADLDAPDLVLLLGVNTRLGDGKNPHMPAIIAAQEALAETMPRCAYVDTAGAETLPPSHTHFTAAGTIEIGKRYAAALLAEEAKKE